MSSQQGFLRPGALIVRRSAERNPETKRLDYWLVRVVRFTPKNCVVLDPTQPDVAPEVVPWSQLMVPMRIGPKKVNPGHSVLSVWNTAWENVAGDQKYVDWVWGTRGQWTTVFYVARLAARPKKRPTITAPPGVTAPSNTVWVEFQGPSSRGKVYEVPDVVHDNALRMRLPNGTPVPLKPLHEIPRDRRGRFGYFPAVTRPLLMDRPRVQKLIAVSYKALMVARQQHAATARSAVNSASKNAGSGVTIAIGSAEQNAPQVGVKRSRSEAPEAAPPVEKKHITRSRSRSQSLAMSAGTGVPGVKVSTAPQEDTTADTGEHAGGPTPADPSPSPTSEPEGMPLEHRIAATDVRCALNPWLQLRLAALENPPRRCVLTCPHRQQTVLWPKQEGGGGASGSWTFDALRHGQAYQAVVEAVHKACTTCAEHKSKAQEGFILSVWEEGSPVSNAVQLREQYVGSLDPAPTAQSAELADQVFTSNIPDGSGGHKSYGWIGQEPLSDCVIRFGYVPFW